MANRVVPGVFFLVNACSWHVRWISSEAQPLAAAVDSGDLATAYELLDSKTRQAIEQVFWANEESLAMLAAYPERARDGDHERWAEASSPKDFWMGPLGPGSLVILRHALSRASRKDFIIEDGGPARFTGLRGTWQRMAERATREKHELAARLGFTEAAAQ
jgi:hypothetical protein